MFGGNRYFQSFLYGTNIDSGSYFGGYKCPFLRRHCWSLMRRSPFGIARIGAIAMCLCFSTGSRPSSMEHKARDIPVVQIFHVEESGTFSVASGHVKTIEGISITPDAVFQKRSHSALVGSGLDVWLVQHGIRRVIISGIRTEQCCETTTRHASDMGYEVTYVTEATLTFPMTDRRGREWSPEEIKARTELVLDGRFARIASVDEALAGEVVELVA